MERFTTVAGRGRAAFEVRGSEFVGHAAPVTGREAAEAFVASVQEEYADATHNVPAYRVREDAAGIVREWQSDDGEPTGSAGKPALNVLQQQDLANVACVVTRYYGGTNLGVGGLARAYARAVKEAVADAGVTERRPHESFAVAVEYDDSGAARSVLESEGAAFDADYGERARFNVRVPRDEAAPLRDRLRSATGGRADIEADRPGHDDRDG
jgi:uncharacterized YigZ family protein